MPPADILHPLWHSPGPYQPCARIQGSGLRAHPRNNSTRQCYRAGTRKIKLGLITPSFRISSIDTRQYHYLTQNLTGRRAFLRRPWSDCIQQMDRGAPPFAQSMVGEALDSKRLHCMCRFTSMYKCSSKLRTAPARCAFSIAQCRHLINLS
uniref:Uncharacterized protein n=1 Tax=Arundo donax TaxID=35708 RepID=A0A0A9DS14_ARUDO